MEIKVQLSFSGPSTMRHAVPQFRARLRAFSFKGFYMLQKPNTLSFFPRCPLHIYTYYILIYKHIIYIYMCIIHIHIHIYMYIYNAPCGFRSTGFGALADLRADGQLLHPRRADAGAALSGSAAQRSCLVRWMDLRSARFFLSARSSCVLFFFLNYGKIKSFQNHRRPFLIGNYRGIIHSKPRETVVC